MTSISAEQDLAVNFQQVSNNLHSSGQPAPEALSSLAGLGYGMVINLATPASRDAVPTEGKLLAETGITYVNIPVDWQNPTYNDFQLFSGILDQAGDRKVLVHCQVNMRASLFTFLYRVVHNNVSPEQAYKFVSEIWTPEDQWDEFARMVLQRHNIDFRLPGK